MPFWMIVNSRFGPLNCSEYDSAFVMIVRKTPDAGRLVGLIHASSEKAFVKLNATAAGTLV